MGLPGDVKVFGDIKPEPDVPNLDKAVAMEHDAAPDLIVGFGGGSAMDLAKLVAVLCTGEAAFADIVGAEKVVGRSMALMQIPTTSGTGSEPAPARSSPIQPAATSLRCRAASCSPISPSSTLTLR